MRHGDASATLAAEGYAENRFRLGVEERPAWDKGHGPPVLVLHELPGLARECVDFAERLIDAGFHVHLPLLFGRPLEKASFANYRRLCIADAFARLRAGEHAPVVDALRVLAQDIGRRACGRRVGVIGMCVTGAYAIPLVIDPAVGAAVASQPGIPLNAPYIATGLGQGPWMAKTNISDADLREAAEVCRRDHKRILVQRFTADRICPAPRVRRIVAALGEAAELQEYGGTPLWRRILFPPHALLTGEYRGDADPSDAAHLALQRVVQFLSAEIGDAQDR